MNGAEAPENRVRVLRRALMYFGRRRAARGQVSVYLAVTRPLLPDTCTDSCAASHVYRKGARQSWFQRNSSGKALAPFVRVARGMKYGVDRDRRPRRLVKHRIRKATY